MSFQIRDALLCEDVRQEINNKHTLVGVFAGDVLVPDFPASIRLSAFFSFIAEGGGTFHIRARISYTEKEPKEALPLDISVDPTDQTAVLVFPTFTLGAPHPGELKFEIDFGDGWRTVLAKKVRQGEVARPGLLPPT